MVSTREQELEQMRNARRIQILDVALELALEKGLMDITIVDIVNKAKISRVTLYKYYKSIHEILFNIQIRILTELLEAEKEEVQNGTNAFEKMESMFKFISHQYQTDSSQFRFIGLFDQLYSKSYPTPELEEKYTSITGQALFTLQELIEEGIQDGSFRKDIDPRLLALTITHILLGTLYRMATRSDVYEKESIDCSDELLQTLISFLITSVSHR
ncbi:TPA: TetR/AcrR family transcriptional regulator [Bacillus toyonensis]|nr:TetR/AcrR family transcriptional regulator [Bacillus toyonensis]